MRSKRECSIVITMNSLFLTLALTDFLVLIDLFDHLGGLALKGLRNCRRS